MQVKTFHFNKFIENTYLIWDETNECIIIDAGNSTEQENIFLQKHIDEKNLKPVAALNTHCHIDHILGIEFLQKTYGIEFWANKKDQYLLDSGQDTANIYGFSLENVPQINKNITEKDIIKFGNTELKVLEVPGHCSGHLAFYNDENKIIFTGDVLFKETIGRTDLPGGDLDQLLDSIKNKIFTLDSNYTVFSGHGENTSIRHEIANNPFF